MNCPSNESSLYGGQNGWAWSSSWKDRLLLAFMTVQFHNEFLIVEWNQERLWCKNWWLASRNEMLVTGESNWSSGDRYWRGSSSLLDTDRFYLRRRDRHLADSALCGGEKTTNHSIDILVLLWFKWKTSPCPTLMTSSNDTHPWRHYSCMLSRNAVDMSGRQKYSWDPGIQFMMN